MVEGTCTVEGCNRPRRRKKAPWCGRCYTRYKRHGDPTFALKPKLPFWDRVEVGGLLDCWLWNGATVSSGYGTVTIKGEIRSPHHIVYQERVGPIPPGMLLVQTCGQRRCCNPTHMAVKDHRSASYWAEREQCSAGHPYTPHSFVWTFGYRVCLKCRRANGKRHDAKPERRAYRKLLGAARRAQKAGTTVAPITRELLVAKVAYWGNRCWMCGGAWGEIDHVKPLAKGGPHVLANLRPACRPCNTRKRAKWPFPTARRLAA